MPPHESNLVEKEGRGKADRYGDKESKRYLAQIRQEYDKWNSLNSQLKGPLSAESDDDNAIIEKRVEYLGEYKDFIDQQHYAEHFDSRSNLHSTVIEQFLYYLFRDLVSDLGNNALLGSSHAFKDIFFIPPNFTEMLRKPHARIEVKDHDFVVGVRVEASFRNVIGTESGPPKSESPEIEEYIFDIPALAVECKTYLDKTMLEGSSRAAEELKARNPNATYIVVSEWLKLTESVNLHKYKVDEIFVLRRQRNTDREDRYDPKYVKNPLYSDIVIHLFNFVRDRLVRDWESTIADGLERGWLVGSA